MTQIISIQQFLPDYMYSKIRTCEGTVLLGADKKGFIEHLNNLNREWKSVRSDDLMFTEYKGMVNLMFLTGEDKLFFPVRTAFIRKLIKLSGEDVNVFSFSNEALTMLCNEFLLNLNCELIILIENNQAFSLYTKGEIFFQDFDIISEIESTKIYKDDYITRIMIGFENHLKINGDEYLFTKVFINSEAGIISPAVYDFVSSNYETGLLFNRVRIKDLLQISDEINTEMDIKYAALKIKSNLSKCAKEGLKTFGKSFNSNKIIKGIDLLNYSMKQNTLSNYFLQRRLGNFLFKDKKSS